MNSSAIQLCYNYSVTRKTVESKYSRLLPSGSRPKAAMQGVLFSRPGLFLDLWLVWCHPFCQDAFHGSFSIASG